MTSSRLHLFARVSRVGLFLCLGLLAGTVAAWALVAGVLWLLEHAIRGPLARLAHVLDLGACGLAVACVVLLAARAAAITLQARGRSE